MFPDFKTLAKVALVIIVSNVARECRFILQNKSKTAMRSRLSEAKSQNLKTINLDAFDYAQASAHFLSMQIKVSLKRVILIKFS